MRDQLFNGPVDPHGYGQEVPPVTVVGPFGIGHVDEVHGERGRPAPEYVPTRQELLILFRHWCEVELRLEAEFCTSGTVGSCEMRLQPYAVSRRNQIRGLLGDEVCDPVYHELREEIGREYGLTEAQ